MKKAAVTTQNNMDADDEKCHKITQLMLAEGEHAQEISELVDALRKIGYFSSFRVKDNGQLGSRKAQKTQERKLKTRRKAAYRRVKKYYKSIKQYKKERFRRKLAWLLTGKFKETEIAEMLGISVRTVIRDLNKIRPYYLRLFRNFVRNLQLEKRKQWEEKLAGLPETARLSAMTDLLIAEWQRRAKERKYRGHYTILQLDLTDTGKYGIPKLTLLPRQTRSARLAYPHKVRVHIKGSYEGKKYEADIGGFNITQTTSYGW